MKKSITIILLCLTFITVNGQGEHVTVKTSEEEMEAGGFSKLLQGYNKIVRVDEEKLTLLKVDLLGPTLYLMSLGGTSNDSVKNNLIRISFEKKTKPNWSWVAGFTMQADQREIRDLEIKGGSRYYYNMNSRILKGKSANNFSANYFGGLGSLRMRPGEDQQQIALYGLYGIQRRLGKYGYIDTYIGAGPVLKSYPEFNTGIDFTLSLEIGLAF